MLLPSSSGLSKQTKKLFAIVKYKLRGEYDGIQRRYFREIGFLFVQTEIVIFVE